MNPNRPPAGQARPSSAHAVATMRANRRTDTSPERALRSELHRRGLRYRVDLPLRVGDKRTRPDVVFTRARVAVFVDGCFWHGCPEHGTMPRANRAFWSKKLADNARRDRAQTDALERAGWRVVRVWEHEPPADAADRVSVALDRHS